jgi:hypothetical protein
MGELLEGGAKPWVGELLEGGAKPWVGELLEVGCPLPPGKPSPGISNSVTVLVPSKG